MGATIESHFDESEKLDYCVTSSFSVRIEVEIGPKCLPIENSSHFGGPVSDKSQANWF